MVRAHLGARSTSSYYSQPCRCLIYRVFLHPLSSYKWIKDQSEKLGKCIKLFFFVCVMQDISLSSLVLFLPLTWKKNGKKRRPKKSKNSFFRKIRGFRSGTNYKLVHLLGGSLTSDCHTGQIRLCAIRNQLKTEPL